MARRKVGRPRLKGGRRRAGSATNGSAAGLLSQVSALVAENLKLARENKELHSVLDTITQSVRRVGSAVGRTSRRVAAASIRRTSGRSRTRRRITDPAALERRRAALAKARQVLAAKRAAARKGK
jgi:hypothetical protein